VRIVKWIIAALVGAAGLAGAAPPPRAPSDVPADPALRSGILPNGMRYEILRNATPPHNAALRLRIASGSLSEGDDERGIAHFVEHMALSGSRNVPEGEMVKRLERAGLRFGPDTNAFTDFRQTYYALNLPETDPATIGTALTLLRESVSEATFAPAAIDRQRGIVLSEERSCANANARSSEEELRFLLKGDLLPQRIPIGLPEVIRTVSRERLLHFYESHYRPDRATLIAVGDFDPATMEAEIRRVFGSWQARGRPAPPPPPPQVAARPMEAHVFVDPALPTQLALAWVGPPDLRPDSRRVRQDRLVTAIGLAILNRRIGRLSSAGPLIAASLARTTFSRRADAVLVSGIAKPGEWKAALRHLTADVRNATERGFGKNEVEAEVASLRTALSVAATGAATRETTTLAQQLLAAVADDRVFVTPAESLAEFEAALPELTPEHISAAVRALLSGAGPLVYLTSPTPVEGADAAVATAYLEAAKAPLPPVVSIIVPGTAEKPWPYTDFGAPGTVAERRPIDSIGAVAVRFANGVRLTVKKTAFSKDEILVAARVGDGRLGLTAEQAPAAFGLGAGAFIQGGLGKLNAEQLREQLAARHASAVFTLADDAIVLSGRTRGVDLELQLQLLAAYVSDPALRPGPWTPVRASAGTLHDQLASGPAGVLTRDGARLLHGGDSRWGIPGREQLAAVGPADARSIVSAMRLAPVELLVVGDVDIDAVVTMAARTFGALPPRTAPSPAAEKAAVRFPPPGLVTLTHKGRGDQALLYIAWPTLDFYADQRRARTLNLLGQVFRQRLIDEIREKLGVSYSPAAGHSASETLPGFGYFALSVEAPPETLDRIRAAAARIAADLRDKPVPQDELERARRPVIENFNRELSGNAFWLGRLAGVQTRPEAIGAIVDLLPQYRSITSAEVQAAARAYLLDSTAWTLKIVPEKAP